MPNFGNSLEISWQYRHYRPLMATPQFPTARILVVDDDRSNVLLLEKILERSGYSNVLGFTDPRLVIPALKEGGADLVLLDLMMPHVDGFELMEQMRAIIPEDTFVPILVLTADVSARAKVKALSGMATDFLTKPFDAAEAMLRIRNLLWLRSLHVEQARYEQELEEIVHERTFELRSALGDLRRAQQQVIQQERMHALAVMAGGVAHDLNNALAVILGFGEFVLRDCERQPSLARNAESMKAIVTAAEDAARMVTRLREFSRPQADEVRLPVYLASLARQAVSLSEPRWRTQARANGSVIEVIADTDKVPLIEGDAAELREVLTNLIFNAVDAMPQGGRITLRTTAENGHVVLEVSDTGTGMSESVRQRCLEPFFTTKGEKGTGLGLAVVYGIVDRHCGTMDIESECRKGTTFRLRFPVTSADHGAAPGEKVAGPEHARILIVDAENTLRRILRGFLEDDGHQVTEAKTGMEALRRFAPGEFDLVITNQVLDDLPGHRVIAEIKERWAPQRVIMLTGFAADSDETGGADLVLAKPVPRDLLRNALAKVLAPIPSHSTAN